MFLFLFSIPPNILLVGLVAAALNSVPQNNTDRHTMPKIENA